MTRSDPIEALRRARALAGLTLVLVAAVFLGTFLLGDDPWVGYLQAAAEAGVIGGLADWFAVTALFRHPLGLPIPHTAIIPRQKDALGRNLAFFLTDNFLDPDTVRERLSSPATLDRMGRWLADPANARSAAGHVMSMGRSLAEGLGSDAVSADIERMVMERLKALPVADLGGRALERLVAAGDHQPVVTMVTTGIRTALDINRPYIRERLRRESPWWVPDAIDDAVFEKAMEIADSFLDEVASDPAHEMRETITARLELLADRLRSDPHLAARVASGAGVLLDQPEVRGWIRAAWGAATDEAAQAGDALERGLQGIGHRLLEDAELRERVSAWVSSIAAPVTEAVRSELEELIPATIERWDPEDTSRRLEWWMGRDLQFVRINGTLVGALIGLTIHTVVSLLGG